MPRHGTNISRITGEVYIKQDDDKKQVKNFLKLKGKVEIETGNSSYATIYDNPDPASGKQSSGVTLFPNSKIVVEVKRGYIEKIEILNGLVMAYVAFGKQIFTPVAEMGGMAWIDVGPDGRTKVANSRETVFNRKTQQSITLNLNQQVLITEDNIGEPEPMEQRFYEAQKVLENLGVFYGAEIYRKASEKSDAMLKASLEALEYLAKKTGQDFKKMKEEVIQQHQKYKQWTQSESEKLFEEAKKITKKDFTGEISVIPINQNIKYQNIECKIISIKREQKSDNEDLLTVVIEAKNESKKQVFIFWNEEVRLINEKGESITIEDYNIETSFMEGAQAKGYLFVPVNKKDKKFILQFGKKSLPKTEIELDLSKTNIKAGD